MPPKSGATTKGKPAAATSSKSKKKCTISDADARNLQKSFAEYDADNSGEISLIELQHFFAQSSAELKDSAADFLSTLDKDGDGRVTFLELLKELYPMTPSKQLNDVYRKYYPEATPKPIKKRPLAPDQVEELRALFCIYDRDGSGMIDMDELLEALPSVGYEEEDFRTLFNTYDIDKNGLLDCEEFLNLMADVFQ